MSKNKGGREVRKPKQEKAAKGASAPAQGLRSEPAVKPRPSSR